MRSDSRHQLLKYLQSIGLDLCGELDDMVYDQMYPPEEIEEVASRLFSLADIGIYLSEPGSIIHKSFHFLEAQADYFDWSARNREIESDIPEARCSNDQGKKAKQSTLKKGQL